MLPALQTAAALNNKGPSSSLNGLGWGFVADFELPPCRQPL